MWRCVVSENEIRRAYMSRMEARESAFLNIILPFLSGDQVACALERWEAYLAASSTSKPPTATTPSTPFKPGDRVRWIGPVRPDISKKLTDALHTVAECWDEDPARSYHRSWIKVRLVGLSADRRTHKDGAFLADNFQLASRHGQISANQ